MKPTTPDNDPGLVALTEATASRSSLGISAIELGSLIVELMAEKISYMKSKGIPPEQVTAAGTFFAQGMSKLADTLAEFGVLPKYKLKPPE